MKILALDISSSTIGWSILESSPIQLIKWGHIKPLKPADDVLFTERLDDAYQKIQTLVKNESPELLVVEEYLNRFTAGKSSAHTIKVLSVFNETVRLAAYHAGLKNIQPTAFSKARAKIKEAYKHKISEKEDAIAFAETLGFKTQLNKLKNIKAECEDEADSIVIGVGYILLNF